MGVRYENRCVDCPPETVRCSKPYCRYWNVPIWFCDNPKCGAENVTLYEVDGEELCLDCAIERLPIVHKE